MIEVPKFGIIEGPQFDYVHKGNPTVDTNPRKLYATWMNLETGELFICIDLSVSRNIWKGQSGGVVGDPYIDNVIFQTKETATNITDVSSSGIPLTNTGVVTTYNLELDRYVIDFNDDSYHLGGVLPAAIGTQDYCIEFFTNSAPAEPYGRYIIIGDRITTDEFHIARNNQSPGFMAETWDGAYSLIFATATGALDNVWQHVAVSRYGGLTVVYINGTRVVDSVLSYSIGQQNFYLGDNGADESLDAYLFGVRITLGESRYRGASSFAVPRYLI